MKISQTKTYSRKKSLSKKTNQREINSEEVVMPLQMLQIGKLDLINIILFDVIMV